MARKVVGKISREMNREINRETTKESVNYSGPKTPSGAMLREPRRVSAPRSEGIGGVYRDNYDDDI